MVCFINVSHIVYVYVCLLGDELTRNRQIPKPNSGEGLGIEWPAQKPDMDELKSYYEGLKAKLS
jgi:hypothetical protein